MSFYLVGMLVVWYIHYNIEYRIRKLHYKVSGEKRNPIFLAFPLYWREIQLNFPGNFGNQKRISLLAKQGQPTTSTDKLTPEQKKTWLKRAEQALGPKRNFWVILVLLLVWPIGGALLFCLDIAALHFSRHGQGSRALPFSR